MEDHTRIAHLAAVRIGVTTPIAERPDEARPSGRGDSDLLGEKQR